MNFSVEKKSSVIARNLELRRKTMIKEEKFHINDSITYNQFLELYSKYGSDLSEEEFAKVFLDLKKPDLYNLKKDRCRILKKENIDEVEIAFLKLELIKRLNLTKGKEISYEELEKLYNFIPTKLSLVIFAEKVLDISSHSVSCIKYNTTKNATMFNKTDDIFFENKEISELQKQIKESILINRNKIQELKEAIALDRNLHIGDSITALEFDEIYEIYGKKYFSDYDFARTILGISDGKARNLINKKIDSTEIWKDEIVSLDYLLKLRKIIIQEEQLHIKDRIKTYDQFKSLYREYSGILSEEMFADEILDMSKTSYKNLKQGKTETIILSDIIVPEEFWNIVKKEIKQKEDVYGGKNITYNEFLELYKKYGYITQDSDFAKNILQISQNHFSDFKRGDYKTTRIFTKNLKKIIV